jgi:signal peptidase II
MGSPSRTGGAKTARGKGKPAPRTPAPVTHTQMRLVAWVAAIIFGVDQALKYLVVHLLQLDLKRSIDVLPPWLNLRMAWNQGVNFGLMSSEQHLMRWILVAIAIAICLWVWIWVWRGGFGRIAQISAGMLIGGALGNVVDRVFYGAVADFLNMSVPGWQNPYSFNVADIAIFAGAFGLVLMPQKKTDPTPVKVDKKPAKVQPNTAQTLRKQGDLFHDQPRDATRDGDGKSG